MRALELLRQSPASQQARTWPDTALGHLIAGIALAACVEFMTLRVLIRLGPMFKFLPHEVVIAWTNAAIFAGGVALNLAALLLLAVLTVWALAGSALSPVLRAALGGSSILAAVVYALGSRTPPELYALFLAASLITMTFGVGQIRRARGINVYLALVVVAGLGLAWGAGVAAMQIPFAQSMQLRALSEAAAVMCGLGAPLLLRPRFDRVALLIGLAAAVVLSAMWLAVRWLPPTLMIWSLSFSAYLPAPLYVLAVGGWLYTFVALARRSETRRLAWGMALIALGGLRWDVAYYVLLAVAGCLVLITAQKPPESTGPRRFGLLTASA